MAPESEEEVVEIRNGAMRARICRYGASVMSLWVPDSAGEGQFAAWSQVTRPQAPVTSHLPHCGKVAGALTPQPVHATQCTIFLCDRPCHCDEMLVTVNVAVTVTVTVTLTVT